jgi:aerotaxis receptor
MVRHPDMPTEAFADMWATLKAGQSWTALVKNRRKDGDHYWVRANATPVRRNGVVTGYLSVRTKPDTAEVQATSRLYQRFREGKARGLAFHKGLVVRTGLMAWTSMFQVMPVRWRIRLAVGLVVLLPMLAVLAAGAAGSTLATLGGALCASALVAILMLEAQIARPLANIVAQAQSVASGQALRNENLDRVDEIGMLLRSVNQAGFEPACSGGRCRRPRHHRGRRQCRDRQRESGPVQPHRRASCRVGADSRLNGRTVQHCQQNADNARQGNQLAMRCQCGSHPGRGTGPGSDPDHAGHP